MAKRIFSTLLLWAIVIGLLYFFGPETAVWLIALVSAGTQYELYGLMEKMGRRPFKTFGTVHGTIMILGPFYANKLVSHPVEGLQAGIIAVTIVACCLRILVHREVAERIETLGATLVGLIYVPFMLTFMARLLTLPGQDRMDEGLMLILWLIVTAKFCDVGALLFGKAFGRHKMSPNTSPGKTWEGAIGGCLVSVGLGYAFVSIAGGAFPSFFTPLWAAVFALPIAILSIISDLVESMMKRSAKQKDSGNFIPGIGGAFDLSDSLILTSPTAFLLLGLLK
ncbi:phosphatidate cytidylyltransferase [Pelagicoccus sp. SDUM812003]|uniref:phosphatidate cytidylyltransferase n=1 Tax=Pelagicoccus sp. SDUM812003 TaxID=3041267 RepID=UPI00281067EE|nr:phosphatidate cytidylyltransferase [Pelagicoccus sp. SDUM812003]MDQ8201855.1 phosphatidate cytidylyltransferase [Pelagicoccus sp. SDUM812003]